MEHKKVILLMITYSIISMTGYYRYLNSNGTYFQDINNSTFELRSINDSSVISNIVSHISKPEETFMDLTSEFNNHKLDDNYDVLRTMKLNGLEPKLVSFNRKRKVQDNSKTLPIPNIVHLVHYGKPYTLQFRHYLHMMGTHKFLQPDYVFIHGDAEFKGHWWNMTLTLVPNVYTVYHEQPRYVFGQKLTHIEHASDVRRLQVLYEYGGVYFDNDVLCVKSMLQLRKYDFVLDREGKNLLANGIMLARRHAPFIRIWLEAYRSYRGRSWTGNSLEKASHIEAIVPHLVHVEKGTLVHPTYRRMDLLYTKHYDWSKNYCIHLYRNEQKKFPNNESSLSKFGGACGEIMRYIWETDVNVTYVN